MTIVYLHFILLIRVCVQLIFKLRALTSFRSYWILVLVFLISFWKINCDASTGYTTLSFFCIVLLLVDLCLSQSKVILLFTLTRLNICFNLFGSLVNTQRRIQILFLFRFTFGTVIAACELLDVVVLTSVGWKLNFNLRRIRLPYLHNCFTLFFVFDCFKFTRSQFLDFSTFVSDALSVLNHGVATITFKNLIVVRYRLDI